MILCCAVPGLINELLSSWFSNITVILRNNFSIMCGTFYWQWLISKHGYSGGINFVNSTCHETDTTI
jgi:hypothetical protein